MAIKIREPQNDCVVNPCYNEVCYKGTALYFDGSHGTFLSPKFRLFDFLHPSQQFFRHVGTGLPGLNQYYISRGLSVLLKDAHNNAATLTAVRLKLASLQSPLDLSIVTVSLRSPLPSYKQCRS